MIFDQTLRQRSGDQADGLRQLRRLDAPAGGGPAMRLLTWPRVILISEFPGTDVGARFGFHLARALSQPGSLDAASTQPEAAITEFDAAHSTAPIQNMLIDLAPAASRLPHVLADHVPLNAYQALWSTLAAGKPWSGYELCKRFNMLVAAESQASPCAVDQLPRVYEQLIRQISRQNERYRWIVMLAVDSVVPLDRACWQAADDVVLIGGDELSSCHRQAAAMRCRIDDQDPQRTVWTLPKRPGSWMRALSSAWLGYTPQPMNSQRWLEAGIASKALPMIDWPERCHALSLREGSRADSRLRRGAQQIADQLRLSAACQGSDDLVKIDGSQKKIQLGRHARPINQITEEFRA
ncbi:MAG: hypothetical protein IT423_21030 [Pirellulaceae bacterium]|nr:hypothetical protein [Pirellulaceae bacterium]